MSKTKKTFRQIPKLAQDPEGLESVNIYCKDFGSELLKIIYPIIEDNKYKFSKPELCVDYYLSQFKNEPSYFHKEYYKSEIENITFYQVHCSKLEYYNEAYELKKVKEQFIDVMVSIYIKLKVPNLTKLKTEIEEWTEEVYNYYFNLFDTNEIENLGILRTYYFDEN